MVVLEDSGLEEYVLGEKTDIIVPVDIFVPDDGSGCVMTSYSCCADFVRTFDERYGGDPLSKEAYSFLSSKMSPFADALGYDADKKSHYTVVEYLFPHDGKLPDGAIIDGTRLFSSSEEADGLKVLTLHGIDPDPDDDDDQAAGFVIDGSIVACASINDYSDDGAVEINVECAKKYRGCGYGTSCVALLVDHLTSRGFDVSYKCRETNKASARIAEKLGFRRVGRRMSYVCYLKQTERTDENGV